MLSVSDASAEHPVWVCLHMQRMCDCILALVTCGAAYEACEITKMCRGTMIWAVHGVKVFAVPPWVLSMLLVTNTADLKPAAGDRTLDACARLTNPDTRVRNAYDSQK